MNNTLYRFTHYIEPLSILKDGIFPKWYSAKKDHQLKLSDDQYIKSFTRTLSASGLDEHRDNICLVVYDKDAIIQSSRRIKFIPFNYFYDSPKEIYKGARSNDNESEERAIVTIPRSKTTDFIDYKFPSKPNIIKAIIFNDRYIKNVPEEDLQNVKDLITLCTENKIPVKSIDFNYKGKNIKNLFSAAKRIDLLFKQEKQYVYTISNIIQSINSDIKIPKQIRLVRSKKLTIQDIKNILNKKYNNSIKDFDLNIEENKFKIKTNMSGQPLMYIDSKKLEGN